MRDYSENGLRMIELKRPMRWLCSVPLVFTTVFTTLSLANEFTPSGPDISVTHPPDQQLVVNLLIWIDENTEYDVTAIAIDPPKIILKTYGDSIDYENEAIIFHEPLKGLYDKERNIIYLEKHWKHNDVRHVGVLLHELIHCAQYTNKQWPCWQKTEWEAYKLHDAWLTERGIDPDFNWIMIFLLSRCEQRDHHPFFDTPNR